MSKYMREFAENMPLFVSALVRKEGVAVSAFCGKISSTKVVGWDELEHSRINPLPIVAKWVLRDVGVYLDE